MQDEGELVTELRERVADLPLTADDHGASMVDGAGRLCRIAALRFLRARDGDLGARADTLCGRKILSLRWLATRRAPDGRSLRASESLPLMASSPATLGLSGPPIALSSFPMNT